MRKKKKHSHNRPVENLQTEAAQLLAKGHYKEAIDAYKRLLKKEQRQEWLTALAKAYLLRAQTLADKEMYKEAAVLWENRANLCKDKECFDQYLYWLIRAGRYIRAANLFLESTEHLSNEAIQLLWAQFGALLLAGYQDVAEAFPEDSPLLKQYALIREALNAYYQRNDEATEEHLKQISSRSPYRDFRSILKALLLINSDPNGVNQLLDKVPLTSPYAHFAALIRMANQQEEFLLEKLGKLGSYGQVFVTGLKGWDKMQLKVISTLQSAAKRDSHQALLEVVVANRQFLGDAYSRQFCLALLPSYPIGMNLYERIFGTLLPFEKNRIHALNYERQGQSTIADRYWRFCVDSLKQHSHKENNALKAALILRHLVELIEKRGDTYEEEDVPDFLIESLHFDPDDKTSYVKLIQWYKHQDDQKNYQKWVDIAVKHFPKESDILLVAIEAATHKKAFKKAVNFAKTLLKVDPINVKARQIARYSHISHARKLIKAGRYTLARKELEQAGQFEKASQRSGLVQINQGLLELQAEGLVKPIIKGRKSRATTTKRELPGKKVNNPKSKIQNNKQPQELLQEGMQLAGGGILGQFRVIVESKSHGLDSTHILSLLSSPDKMTLTTRHNVLGLISLIKAYSEEGITFLVEAIEQIKAPLSKAAKLEFSKDERLTICQCLKDVKHNGLLKQFADHALKQWPESPIFVFYQIYGKTNGNVWVMPMPEMERLKQAAEKAEREGDKRTSVMIMGFLNQVGGGILPPPFLNPFDDDDFDDLDDDFDNFEDELEALGNMDPDDLSPADLIKILHRLEQMGIEIPDFGFPIPGSSQKKRPKKR